MLNNISGFPEFLPNEQIIFNFVLNIIKEKFELYGFIPLETSAIEKVTTLLSKGNDNEIYGIYRLKDENSKKELGLRFDLTVPLARYVAKNYGSLAFPYKRYQISPVWRGERAQSGRYKQFYQCDIDIVGDTTLDTAYDAEVVCVIYDIFKAIGLKNFTIKINNRNILFGLIESFEINDVNAVIRIIDKIEKISKETFIEELTKINITKELIDLILEIKHKSQLNNNTIEYMQNICTNAKMQKGIEELKEILKLIESFSVKNIKFDPMLARGLDYYTGSVFEIILNDFPDIGSICGGGRYDNLVSSFTNKIMPGVGLSIGVTRLIPKLLELNFFDIKDFGISKVLITMQEREMMDKYIAITNKFRKNNINTELYMQNKPLSSQMKYANKKGFNFVVIANKEELNNNQIIIRNLFTGEQKITTIELIDFEKFR